MAIEVTDESFRAEVLEEKLPVLVDFWAPWCGPCRMVAPVIEEISNEYSSRLKVCKVNVDESSASAAEYGIMSIPTLGIFIGGKLVDSVVGALPKQAVIEKIEPYLEELS